jgi:putative SOS response-associated peptidase YedK
MCGRFTNKLTWAEIVALYRLGLQAPPRNLQPRFNICPADPVDVVTEQDGKRNYVRIRWGLIPRWWSKPLKRSEDGDLQCASGNHRDEAVLSRRIQAHALPDLGVRRRRPPPCERRH